MINIPRYKVMFLFLDFLLLIIFLLFTNVFYHTIYEDTFQITNFVFLKVIIKFLLIAAVLSFIFRNNDLYKINVLLKPSSHLRKLISAWLTFIFLVTLIGVALYYFFEYSFINLLINSLILSLIFIAFRILVVARLYKFISQKYLRNNVLLVGDGNSTKLLAAELFLDKVYPINIVGVLSDQIKIGEEFIPGMKVIGKTTHLKKTIENYEIDELIFSADDEEYSSLIEKLDELKEINVRIKISSDLLKTLYEKTDAEQYYGVPLLNIHQTSKLKLLLIYKRIFDLFFAALGIIALTPLFAVVFVLIKITSKGPAIFSQERIGKNGKAFKFYKFRSMTIDDNDDREREKEMKKFIETNQKGNDEFKVINQKRLTKIGKFIRKTSIDELPQLFNVIKGDMSLVGPRPCLPYEYSKYTNWQKKRVNVLPGCTGLWQVFGRNKVSFLDSTIMDIYYTYTMSPLTDLEYIYRTFPAIFLAKGK